MPIRLMRGVFAAALLSMVLSASSASASTRIYVRVGPPVPIVEVRPVAPGPRYVWVDGYHRWDGRAYAWVPGQWVLPPRAHAVWVPGRWVHEKRGYYWIDGHWRR
jgi:YXWGXW repeat-containing protein